MSSIEELLIAGAERAMEIALSRRELNAPTPYPIGVSISDAARLISVSEAKVREMVRTGELRTMRIPGSRVVIPTIALFELDPGFTPEHRAQVLRLDLDQEPAA